MPFRRTLALLTVLICLGLTPTVDAHAGAAEAEQYRLQTEMESLARKSAWAGVERTFKELEAVGLPLTLGDYLLGSQSAIQAGDLLLGLQRVQTGLASATPDDNPESAYARAKALAAGLSTRFGQVRLRVPGEKACTGHVMWLKLEPVPFAEDEREAYSAARTKVGSFESFTGLLPTGEYNVDGYTFKVEPGQPMATVELCKGP